MRKILVLQHVPHEGLGTIGAALRGHDLNVDFLKIYENRRIPPDIKGYSALIVMGGPMGVYEDDIYPFIRKEIRLIGSALKTDTPVLGICLGSQLLAKAAGARVYKGKAKEIGWYRTTLTDLGATDSVFLGLPKDFTVFHWHGDTFDIPPGGKNLASSELFPHQAIRVGRRAYGFQFHLEVTEAMISEWIKVNEEELKPLKGIDPEGILKETPKRIGALHSYGSTVISRFLRLVD